MSIMTEWRDGEFVKGSWWRDDGTVSHQCRATDNPVIGHEVIVESEFSPFTKIPGTRQSRWRFDSPARIEKGKPGFALVLYKLESGNWIVAGEHPTTTIEEKIAIDRNRSFSRETPPGHLVMITAVKPFSRGLSSTTGVVSLFMVCCLLTWFPNEPKWIDTPPRHPAAPIILFCGRLSIRYISSSPSPPLLRCQRAMQSALQVETTEILRS